MNITSAFSDVRGIIINSIVIYTGYISDASSFVFGNCYSLIIINVRFDSRSAKGYWYERLLVGGVVIDV